MVETGPHHLELIDQLLMERAHFWVHELLMNCQPNSKDMDLLGDRPGHSVSQGAALDNCSHFVVHSLSLLATGLKALLDVPVLA